MTIRELREAKLLQAKEILDGTDDRTLTAAQKNRIAELRRDAQELKELEDRERMAYQPSNTLDVDPADLLPITDENGYGFRRSVMEANRATKAPRAEFRDMHGRPIYVLNPEHRLSSLPSENRNAGVTAGEMIAAWLAPHRRDVQHARRALNESVNTQGGILVADQQANGVIDLVRNASVVVAAGARTIPMTSDHLVMARVATDPAPVGVAENAEMTESNPTFDAITMTALKIGCLCKVSRELAEDAPNLPQLLETIMATALAKEIDRQCLVGNGSAEITGLHLLSGLTETSVGVPTDYAEALSALGKLWAVNADANAWVMTPSMALKYESLLATANGNYLTPPESIGKLQRLVTAALPTTGYTTTDEMAAFMGDFRKVLLGVRRQIEVVSSDQRYFEYDQIGFKVTARVDMNLERANHMCYMSGLKSA